MMGFTTIKRQKKASITGAFFFLFLLFFYLFGITAFGKIEYQTLLTDRNKWSVNNTFITNGEYPSDKNELKKIDTQKENCDLWGSWGGSDTHCYLLFFKILSVANAWMDKHALFNL